MFQSTRFFQKPHYSAFVSLGNRTQQIITRNDQNHFKTNVSLPYSREIMNILLHMSGLEMYQFQFRTGGLGPPLSILRGVLGSSSAYPREDFGSSSPILWRYPQLLISYYTQIPLGLHLLLYKDTLGSSSPIL